MRRAIQKEIEDNLSEEILKGRFIGANKIIVELEEDRPVFRVANEEEIITASVN
jgi:ATP-dependent Clp protease ATP-binding subunit ClpC